DDRRRPVLLRRSRRIRFPGHGSFASLRMTGGLLLHKGWIAGVAELADSVPGVALLHALAGRLAGSLLTGLGGRDRVPGRVIPVVGVVRTLLRHCASPYLPRTTSNACRPSGAANWPPILPPSSMTITTSCGLSTGP